MLQKLARQSLNSTFITKGLTNSNTYTSVIYQIPPKIVHFFFHTKQFNLSLQLISVRKSIFSHFILVFKESSNLHTQRQIIKYSSHSSGLNHDPISHIIGLVSFIYIIFLPSADNSFEYQWCITVSFLQTLQTRHKFSIG